MKFYTTGTCRGLGEALKDYYGTTKTQVDLQYKEIR